MSKRLKLEVTQEDIDEAVASAKYSVSPQPTQCRCPMARALSRLSDGGSPGFAAYNVLVCDDKPYKASRGAREFMDLYDKRKYKKLKPRTFWLTPL
jgi:hypothetical protein